MNAQSATKLIVNMHVPGANFRDDPQSLHAINFRERIQCGIDAAKRFVADAISMAHLFPGVGEPDGCPFGVVLDVQALRTMVRWERQGLDFHVRVGLQNSNEAIETIVANTERCLVGNIKYPQAGYLAGKIMNVLIQCTPWQQFESATSRFSIDGDISEMTSIDELAQFLWQNRHSFTSNKSNVR